MAEKATATQDKLRGSESEIKTLKGLLTSKTAMVERRKRDLAEARARLCELEERDNRRSVGGGGETGGPSNLDSVSTQTRTHMHTGALLLLLLLQVNHSCRYSGENGQTVSTRPLGCRGHDP